MRPFIVSTALGLLALFTCPVTPAHLHAQEKTVTLEAYLDLESVSNPQISPDGRQILFTRGGIDGVNDRRYSAIWMSQFGLPSNK